MFCMKLRTMMDCDCEATTRRNYLIVFCSVSKEMHSNFQHGYYAFYIYICISDRDFDCMVLQISFPLNFWEMQYHQITRCGNRRRDVDNEIGSLQ